MEPHTAARFGLVAVWSIAAVTLVPIAMASEPPAEAPPRHFLLARDGQQCVLQEQAEAVADGEKARLETLGAEVRRVWVSFLLRDDHLPEACVPAETERFFVQHQWAASGVKRSAGPVCEACGCPETWFFCIASNAPAAELEALGYAPVE